MFIFTTKESSTPFAEIVFVIIYICGEIYWDNLLVFKEGF